jgi:hypothetical protein
VHLPCGHAAGLDITATTATPEAERAGLVRRATSGRATP